VRFRQIAEYLNHIGFEAAEDGKHPDHAMHFFGGTQKALRARLWTI
jgi:hypothetical protein